MATYNGAKYLQEQLDSFLRQDRLPDELIITDDCSQDDTQEIIKRFANKASFEVRWERNEKNLGYSGNFRKALMKTTGDVIFLSDQDDCWFPEKISKVVEVFLRQPDIFVVSCDATLTDSDLNSTGVSRIENIRRLNKGENQFVTGCCSAFTSCYLDHALPALCEGVSHDAFLVGLAARINRREIVYSPLQYFRRHRDNATSGWDKSIDRSRFSRNVRRVFRAFGKPNLERELMEKRCIASGIASVAEAGLVPCDEAIRDSQKSLEREIRFSEMRAEVLRKRKINRVIPSARLYWLGGYRQYHGAGTAVRDVFR